MEIVTTNYSILGNDKKNEITILIPDDDLTAISIKGENVCSVVQEVHDVNNIIDRNKITELSQKNGLSEYEIFPVVRTLQKYGIIKTDFKEQEIKPHTKFTVSEVKLRHLFERSPYVICATPRDCTGSGETVGGAT